MGSSRASGLQPCRQRTGSCYQDGITREVSRICRWHPAVVSCNRSSSAQHACPALPCHSGNTPAPDVAVQTRTVNKLAAHELLRSLDGLLPVPGLFFAGPWQTYLSQQMQILTCRFTLMACSGGPLVRTNLCEICSRPGNSGRRPSIGLTSPDRPQQLACGHCHQTCTSSSCLMTMASLVRAIGGNLLMKWRRSLVLSWPPNRREDNKNCLGARQI